MEQYDPAVTPPADVWLALGESERLELVRDFHDQTGEKIPEGGETAHAAIHVIVENQIAMAVEPVAETIKKLVRQGLGRHEAVHAVDAVLSEDLYDLMHGKEQTWDQTRYKNRLEKLTAKRWRKGRW